MSHVDQRAYWFQWRRDVDIFCSQYDMCDEFHCGRIPMQGMLIPMVLGAPVARWACDLAGLFPRSSSGHIFFGRVFVFSANIL